MAAAAEASVTQTELYNWDLAEEQFSAGFYICPPESEIYGRSLSAVRRLGALMIEKTLAEIVVSPEAAQARVEFFTSVEEGFGTDIELGGGLEVRDFDERPIIDGLVMAKDNKTPISVMTAAGVKNAQEKYAKESIKGDHRFFPQLTRSERDHENALIVDEMARGQTDFNTRIVISPFPEESAIQSGNDYWRRIGYVPHLKRGFVQLYHMNGSELISGSLSFDGSNKQRLIEVFSQLGIEIPENEITDNWLNYAFTGKFTEEQAKEMATAIADMAGNSTQKKSTNTVDVTKKYGPIMERAFNESYVHICESLARGGQTEGAKGLIRQFAANAHNYNRHYAEALRGMIADVDTFSDDDSIVLHELLVYSTIEMMRALHLKETTLFLGNPMQGQRIAQISPELLYEADALSFQNMLGGFGAKGAKSNRVYSACGLEVTLGDDKDNSDKNGNPQTAYGSVDGGGEESSGKKMMTCPFCGAKVWGDPCARVLSCWDCNAYTKNGRVRYKGDGGHKVRAERVATKEEERRKRRSAKIAAAAERADRRKEAEDKVDEAYRESGLSF